MSCCTYLHTQDSSGEFVCELDKNNCSFADIWNSFRKDKFSFRSLLRGNVVDPFDDLTSDGNSSAENDVPLSQSQGLSTVHFLTSLQLCSSGYIKVRSLGCFHALSESVFWQRLSFTLPRDKETSSRFCTCSTLFVYISASGECFNILHAQFTRTETWCVSFAGFETVQRTLRNMRAAALNGSFASPFDSPPTLPKVLPLQSPSEKDWHTSEVRKSCQPEVGSLGAILVLQVWPTGVIWVSGSHAKVTPVESVTAEAGEGFARTKLRLKTRNMLRYEVISQSSVRHVLRVVASIK